jgi:probable H4MPT-linked C1 transfer pathway protein
MPPDGVIGWDLGGAHLKAARLGAGGRVERVVQRACALWRGLHQLDAALDSALPEVGDAPVHVVTMTGEMVDLFPTRAAGVACLAGEMRRRFPEAHLRFYGGPAGLVEVEAALTAPEHIASANWLATASLVAARLPDAILVDIGSTTTDLAVIRRGAARTVGRSDAERLVTGELVYTGVARTPVMALGPEVPFAGEKVPLMAELFATSADVHRLTGRLPEGADLYPSADGGPKTPVDSARRLARMLGRDLESAPLAAWRALAEWLAGAQLDRIAGALQRLLTPEPLPAAVPIVAAGVGRFLASDLAARLGRPLVEFADLLPDGGGTWRGAASDCAPAVAVAWLAAREAGAVSPPAAAARLPAR